MWTISCLSLALVCLTAAPARAAPTFAALADLTIAGPIIVKARITRTERRPDRESPGLAPGHSRLLVTVAVVSALVAPIAIPAQLVWLWDAPLDARGKPVTVKNLEVMAWIGAPDLQGRTRLIAPDAQQPWSPAIDASVRTIAIEQASATVPVITAVVNGFRGDGTVAGESESQFLLGTANGPGATLVVTSRPGMPPRITVARGDIIDDSAGIVKPGSLLWYRLACVLPAVLPVSAGGGDVALAADWRAAIASLGPCTRQPGPA